MKRLATDPFASPRSRMPISPASHTSCSWRRAPSTGTTSRTGSKPSAAFEIGTASPPAEKAVATILKFLNASTTETSGRLLGRRRWPKVSLPSLIGRAHRSFRRCENLHVSAPLVATSRYLDHSRDRQLCRPDPVLSTLTYGVRLTENGESLRKMAAIHAPPARGSSRTLGAHLAPSFSARGGRFVTFVGRLSRP